MGGQFHDLTGMMQTQLTTRFDLRARCSSRRSFVCPCLMASFVARSAGAVSIARSMEVMFATTFSKRSSKYDTLEVDSL